ncbi:phosphate transport system regulatory protein PhoU [Salibacterium salarium]|uniref:Phosphate-specific transport system accessory protein PhoU n=1 Tax=Salibacterium salarium TaxID=284579 RepID=A0A428N1J1_9BACI|nr:phosphate signaling complex protein PhoU [Salibacterium salarium]RSL32293.1 phosphate transport system regulatory protein PhoU [Salibacterium salarium]
MGVRGSYEQELSQLKKDLFVMGEQVIQAFSASINLIQTQDKLEMEQLIENDTKINQAELTIHDDATMMIARQQPVATDLRTTIVALKISSDLERVGDLAVDIVKASRRMEEKKNEEEINAILEMAEVAQDMLKKAMLAYQERDMMKAQQIATMDDTVDKKYRLYIQSLFTLTDETNAEQTTQLAFIGRYVERIADYATNLAEWIVYESSGKHFDLN